MSIDHKRFKRTVLEWKGAAAGKLPELTKTELCDAYLALWAKLDQYRKDTERLDYLERGPFVIARSSKQTWRGLIDAAMSAQSDMNKEGQ